MYSLLFRNKWFALGWAVWMAFTAYTLASQYAPAKPAPKPAATAPAAEDRQTADSQFVAIDSNDGDDSALSAEDDTAPDGGDDPAADDQMPRP